MGTVDSISLRVQEALQSYSPAIIIIKPTTPLRGHMPIIFSYLLPKHLNFGKNI